MKNIRQLDPSKITKNGYYFDVDGTNMFLLTDEEILAMRAYYKDSLIASSRVMKQRKNKNYKVTKNQIYSDGKHTARKTSKKSPCGYKFVVVSGLIVAVTIYSVSLLASAFNTPVIEEQTYQLQEEVRLEPITLSNMELADEAVRSIPLNTNLVGSSPEQVLNENVVLVSSIMDENKERREWVQKYCDIYQVDFDITYNRLVEITNNFTDSEYLNGHILGVTCKGVEVFASSEEELILYYVRCVKQKPLSLGISTDNLYVHNDYVSTDDYATMIGYYNNLVGADPVLSYAITQAETSWNSELFRDSNNPAGLRINGNWWRFDTKEEGFIELALEILKFNRMGAYTIEEIGAIHAPVEDNNENWIPNVTDAYTMVSGDSELLDILQANSEKGFTR